MFRELQATAPQTYYTFRASNGAADVLYVLLKSLTAQVLQALFLGGKNMGGAVVIAVDKSTRMFQFVKIAADVRQRAYGTLTYIVIFVNEVLEVNFC